MAKKFPRAAAYIKAEEWSCGANYERSKAGKKAKEAIINGEDYEEAIKTMENEWNAYCMISIWD